MAVLARGRVVTGAGILPSVGNLSAEPGLGVLESPNRFSPHALEGDGFPSGGCPNEKGSVPSTVSTAVAGESVLAVCLSGSPNVDAVVCRSGGAGSNAITGGAVGKNDRPTPLSLIIFISIDRVMILTIQ